MLIIRLTRIGKKNQPKYRLVLTEHTYPIKGKFIEILGHYDPSNDEFEIKKDRVEHWLKNGSKVSQTAASLLKKKGIKNQLDISNKKGGPKPKKKDDEKSGDSKDVAAQNKIPEQKKSDAGEKEPVQEKAGEDDKPKSDKKDDTEKGADKPKK